jgi:hypothetical protein
VLKLSETPAFRYFRSSAISPHSEDGKSVLVALKYADFTQIQWLPDNRTSTMRATYTGETA